MYVCMSLHFRIRFVCILPNAGLCVCDCAREGVCEGVCVYVIMSEQNQSRITSKIIWSFWNLLSMHLNTTYRHARTTTFRYGNKKELNKVSRDRYVIKCGLILPAYPKSLLRLTSGIIKLLVEPGRILVSVTVWKLPNTWVSANFGIVLTHICSFGIVTATAKSEILNLGKHRIIIWPTLN